MSLTILHVIKVILVLVLLLLVRKLVWCLRSLWCLYRGRALPAPISLIPQQSGRVFDRHVAQAVGEETEEQEE